LGRGFKKDDLYANTHKEKGGRKMLKKLAKLIRRNLLKINWLRREVEAYKLREKKRLHRENWARLMHSGCKVRNLKPEKKDITDTLSIVTDDGMIVDYIDGRMVGQRAVTPRMIRPWGLWRW